MVSTKQNRSRRNKVRCGDCFLWFPSQHHLDAHQWIEHMTEDERKEYVDNLKANPKPLPPADEIFKGFKED